METFDPNETAAAAFENEALGHWETEVYFADAPDEESMRQLITETVSADAAHALRFETLADVFQCVELVKNLELFDVILR